MATWELVGIPRGITCMTLMADGTFVTGNTRQYGAGDQKTFGFQSTEHATWKQTGPREISASSLVLGYNSKGKLTRILNSKGVITFNEDLSEFSGQVVLHFVNPLNLPGLPVVQNVLGGTVTGILLSGIPGSDMVAGKGDANGDGTADVSDVIYLLSYLFLGGPEPISCGGPGSFGKEAAGTYLCPYVLGRLPPSLYLLTLVSDGTYIRHDARQYGGGDQSLYGFLSTEFGAWRQRGATEISTRSVALGFDSTGKLSHINDVPGTISFLESLSQLSAHFDLNYWNPFDFPDLPVAQNVLNGTFVGTRLEGSASYPRSGKGDLNGDFLTDVSDAVYLLDYLFQAGPEPLCGSEPPDSLATKAAGTYLASIQVPNAPSGLSLLTLGSDGIYIGTGNRQYGAGDRATNGFAGTEHGNWRQTGSRELTSTSLTFGFDSNGKLARIEEFRSTLSFNDDFGEFRGVFVVDYVNPLKLPELPVKKTVIQGALNGMRHKVE